VSGADLALRVLGTMLAGLAAAAPELFDLLSPSEREAFESIIARGKGHLPAAGAAHAAVAAIFATAPTAPAPAPAVAARFRIAPSTTRTLAEILRTRGMQLSGEERVELAAAHALVEAFDRGEVVLASPLAPPVLFGEPDHGED